MIIIFKLVENETFKTSEFGHAICSPNLGHGLFYLDCKMQMWK